MSEEMRLVEVIAQDDDGNDYVQLVDIWIGAHWCGSRRTKEQCEKFLAEPTNDRI